jgi:hypothetical protein
MSGTQVGQIPAAFFQRVSVKEGVAILRRNGLLTRAQTRLLWELLGQSGAPPVARARIVLDADDLQAWLHAYRVGRH